MLVDFDRYWPALLLHAVLLYLGPALVVILLLTDSYLSED